MKVTYLIAGIFTAMTLSSCGGGSSNHSEEMDFEEMDSEMSEDVSIEEEEEIEKSSSEMLSDYQDMLKDYQDILADGTVAEIAEMKQALDVLELAATSQLVGSELEAIQSLASLSLQLANGKDIDLSSALESYDDLLNATKVISGNKDAIDAMEGVMDALKDMPEMPDMPDLDDF